MKKIVFFVCAIFTLASVQAQSERYTKVMTEKVAAVDTVRTADGWRELANTFERIADAEKTQWLPYYYAALAQVNTGYFSMNSNNPTAGGMSATIDPLADKAEALLTKAKANYGAKEYSEFFVLEKMIASMRMMADPMTRWQQYGPVAAQALAKAKALDPENPRVYYLEGQDKYYTPEQFGGSKTEAKKLFEEAVKKFATHKEESALHPHWGKGSTVYFLAMASK